VRNKTTQPCQTDRNSSALIIIARTQMIITQSTHSYSSTTTLAHTNPFVASELFDLLLVGGFLLPLYRQRQVTPSQTQ
jgi:hypothetical protein